jgi:hypothetical protein
MVKYKVKSETIEIIRNGDPDTPVTLMNGCVYKGEWVNGFRNGKGKLTWPCGSIYEGDFKIDMAWGKGKLTKRNGFVH